MMSRLFDYLGMSAVGIAGMAGLIDEDLIYADSKSVPYRKSHLTNKQLKARRKNKIAKKQRRKQR